MLFVLGKGNEFKGCPTSPDAGKTKIFGESFQLGMER